MKKKRSSSKRKGDAHLYRVTRAVFSTIVIVLAMFCSGLASANDSTAVLAAGGLQLVKSNDIAILSEKLRVSPSRISVDYEMQNVSDKPVETVVAFPLPRLEGPSLINVPHDLSRSKPENFVDFKTVVNGAPVQPALQVKAYQLLENGSLGREVTADLAAAQILMSPADDEFYNRLVALPLDTKRELAEGKLLLLSDDRPEGDCTPLWAVEYFYHFEQRFEPGKVVRVHHEYTPVVGRSFFHQGSLSEEREKWCIDAGTEKAIAALIKKTPAIEGFGDVIVQKRVEYILKTGANWAGPIRSFELTISKEHPEQIVSLCAKDVQRVSATELRVTRTNFTPTIDLAVVFFDGQRPKGG